LKSWFVILTKNAKTDLKNIHDHIAFELFSPQTAFAQIDHILDAAENLAVFPKKHPLCRHKGLAKKGLHAASAGRYRILYTISENTKEVYVARVLYGGCDLAKAFLPE
jgi:toxin ParE1/3/4